ncbi:hypothetical protein P3485_22115 [Vibrio parahaemolyticus]|nr:hypothetical protein [Vibrio parahaemolyticus]MDF4522958.1 hypothetical protein [Vibrio parahaemolyticus]MDF4540980.1 hypothetical protein [Vibrio parahaemolyticus]MDF4550130.1 hypothetical protein [Vibrio parahaemolyticus]
MLKRIFSLMLVAFLIGGCVNRDEVYATPPVELIEYVDGVLPAAEQFVYENERKALENGIKLNAKQMDIARKEGLKYPEKVRLYYVDRLPFPEEPELAKEYGYSSPFMGAYTYGYGIWIKRAESTNQVLLSHELIHVRQAEQMGLKEQTKQYLLQLFIYGYENAPMEKEAYSEANKYT